MCIFFVFCFVSMLTCPSLASLHPAVNTYLSSDLTTCGHCFFPHKLQLHNQRTRHSQCHLNPSQIPFLLTLFSCMCMANVPAFTQGCQEGKTALALSYHPQTNPVLYYLIIYALMYNNRDKITCSNIQYST